jgi:23S rRNA pseudouridine1911/1915/1917 synthase
LYLVVEKFQKGILSLPQDSEIDPGFEPFIPDILYEDNHLLVVNKPAGMLTQDDASAQVSLLEHLRNHIKIRDRKPGNVYLGMVQRLDKPVSGSIVFAKTSKAAARISAQIRARHLEKYYLAVTEAGLDHPKDLDSTTDGWCMISHNLRRIRDKTVVDHSGSAAQKARLRIKTLLQNGRLGIHAVQLITGRKHQIRAQLSARAMPIVGDRKYGSSFQPRGGSILLHSYLVHLVHPTKKTKLVVRCPPPEDFFSVFSGQERNKIHSALDDLAVNRRNRS